MGQHERKLVIGITTPLEMLYAQEIASHDFRRTRVLYRPDLLPPAQYIADHTGPASWQRTDQQQGEWEDLLSQCDILWDVPYREPKSFNELCPNVKWIQTTSAGVGPRIKELGLADTDIIVTTASGIHAVPLAEFAIGAFLYFTKLFPTLEQRQSQKHWERYAAGELRGQTLVIVGPGKIGSEIARLGKAFGMHVIGVGAREKKERLANASFDEHALFGDLDSVLPQADALVLSCPHTPETENLINPDRVATIKPGAMLVNIARGLVIDEEAMILALQSGQIAFAALDVFNTEPLPADSPLWSLPNVLVSPHSASTAFKENERLVEIFLTNLDHFLNADFDKMTPRLDLRRGY